MTIIYAESVSKGRADSRDYNFLTLENGLKMLLISDPSADISAVALDVNVGSYQDPQNLYGLAHFTEHLLFLGTKKYPQSDDYSQFISRNNGFTNAFTSNEHTNYHFSVNTNALEGALDRFSQFFINPLFLEEYVDKERKAVHSEHLKNLQSDFRRIYQVIKTQVNSSHPFSRFSTGNIDTLGGEASVLAQKSRQFFENYYSSDAMTLTILSDMPPEKLEELGKHFFQTIPLRKKLSTEISEPILTTKEKLTSFEIKTLREENILQLNFFIPSSQEYYYSKPLTYISHLLGHEGKNTLFSYLQKNGWVNSLSAGNLISDTNFSIFSLTLSLTKNGVLVKDEIIENIFAYINLIKNSGIEKWRYEELKNIADINFHFGEKTPAVSTVVNTANILHKVQPVDVIRYPFIYDEYKPQLIKLFLDELVPKNMLLYYSAQDVTGNIHEKWYGTEYAKKDISESQINKWNTILNKTTHSYQHLQLPQPNPFIVKDISLENKKNDTSKPSLLINNPKIKLWYAQDTSFKSPKIYIDIQINIPQIYSSIENSLYGSILIEAWKEALSETTYPALLVGIDFSLERNRSGINIFLTGYPQNVSFLLSTITDVIQNTQINEELFEKYKEKIAKKWRNIKFAAPYRLSLYELNVLLNYPLWHRSDYIKILPTLKLSLLKKFSETLFHKHNQRIFVFGNISEERALATGKKLENTFQGRELLRNEKNLQFILKLKKKKTEAVSYITEDKNNALLLLYQNEERTYKDKVSLDLIDIFMSNAYYNELRTQQQLGYIVQSGVFDQGGVFHYFFLVQSSKNPMELQQQTEKFVEKQHTIIQNIPTEDFLSYKAALLQRYQEKPQNLYQQFAFFKEAITQNDTSFTRKDKYQKILTEYSQNELIAFYKQMFINKDKKYLPIHILKKGSDILHTSNLTDKNTLYFISSYIQ